MPRDGSKPDELDILVSGTFNLGFVAVDRRATPFLRWWQERLRWDCLHDVTRGLFVDQRWVDLAVHYFPYTSLRDEGCNVAYWNVDQRPLHYVDTGYFAGESPLRFFHFSGYRPDNPAVLSRHHLTTARHDPSSSGALGDLCRAYSAELSAAGYDSRSMQRYGYEFAACGIALTSSIRRRYRDDLIAARARGRTLPDAFDDSEAQLFKSWLRASATLRQRRVAALPRSLRLIAKAVDDPARAKLVLRSKIAHRSGRLLRGRREPGRAFGDAPLGVTVVGYLRAEDGVGQGARSMVSCLRAAGIPHSVVATNATPTRQEHEFSVDSDPTAYPIDVVCANADMFGQVVEAHSSAHGAARYTIGVWAWEVEQFPVAMRSSAGLVDEVWTLSRHSANAIAPVIDKPVLVFPYPVVPVTSAALPDLDLPDGFRFLFCFDMRSGFRRKNPLGVVEAFRAAFSPGEGPHLVVKSVNGAVDRQALESLRAAARGREDIYVVDAQLSPGEQAALMDSCDCYVSLHRAEGLGFTIGEAMAAGKPVIATAYSGNLEFMSVANSYLVPYELVPIGAGSAPYEPDGRWAEPDVAAAAAWMRHTLHHPEETAARAALAKRDIHREHSPAARAGFLRARMAVIGDVLSQRVGT